MTKFKNYHFFTLAIFVVLIKACTYDDVSKNSECDNQFTLELAFVNDADCGVNNGQISVRVIETEGSPYTFNLNGDKNTSGIFENLSTGTYTIQVESVAGCSQTINANINNSNGVNIAAIESFDSECGSNSGRIVVTATGGLEPYQFKIDGVGFQSENEFTGLTQGKYTVVVTDVNDCEVSQDAEIKSDAVFETVHSIINQSCATSGCHGGNVSPDFRVKDNIISRANSIKSRTGNKSMPSPSSGITLSDEEIEQIACWVNDGAVE